MRNSLIVILCLIVNFEVKSASDEWVVREVKSDTIEIIKDPLFKKGLRLRGNDSGNPQTQDFLRPYGGEGEPVWDLCEWGCKLLLKGSRPVKKAGGIVSYKDQSKIVTLTPLKNDMQVRLDLRTSQEYTEPRKAGEAWPHLLVEQRFQDLVRLSDLKELIYQINAQLIYSENKMKPGTFNEGLHTSQITFYLSIQNRKTNDYLWFGLPLYDYRYEEVPFYAAQDLGKGDATGKYIYTIAGKELFSGSMKNKQWISISKDIYPYLEKAFADAQAKGYLKDTTFDDLVISSMNLGWEIPGTFDSAIQWKGLRLSGVKK
jgi:hypothetical protein